MRLALGQGTLDRHLQVDESNRALNDGTELSDREQRPCADNHERNVSFTTYFSASLEVRFLGATLSETPMFVAF